MRVASAPLRPRYTCCCPCHCCCRLPQVEAWNRVLVAGAAAASSGLTKEGFLTRWGVITLEDPRTAFEQVGTVTA
jgi:hypothetical protein